MTVLQKPELGDYLDKLVNQYRNDIISAKQPEKASTNTQMILILEAEKEFLYNSRDDPELNFDLNGLPSVESLSQDLIAMREWDEYNDIGNAYKENLESKVDENYQKANSEEFREKILSYGENTNLKTNFTLENKDKALRLTIVENYFANGIDEHSKTTPVAKKIIKTDYQVAWNNLFSKTKSSYHLLNLEASLVPETKPAVTKDTQTRIIKTMRNDIKKMTVNTAKTAKNLSLAVSTFYFALPTFARKYMYEKGFDSVGPMPLTRLILEAVPFITIYKSLGSKGVGLYLTGILATNSASLIYEWYNKSKKKVEKQIKKENKLKQLK